MLLCMLYSRNPIPTNFFISPPLYLSLLEVDWTLRTPPAAAAVHGRLHVDRSSLISDVHSGNPTCSKIKEEGRILQGIFLELINLGIIIYYKSIEPASLQKVRLNFCMHFFCLNAGIIFVLFPILQIGQDHEGTFILELQIICRGQFPLIPITTTLWYVDDTVLLDYEWKCIQNSGGIMDGKLELLIWTLSLTLSHSSVQWKSDSMFDAGIAYVAN